MKLKRLFLMAVYVLVGVVFATEATAFDKAGVTGTTSAECADSGTNML